MGHKAEDARRNLKDGKQRPEWEDGMAEQRRQSLPPARGWQRTLGRSCVGSMAETDSQAGGMFPTYSIPHLTGRLPGLTTEAEQVTQDKCWWVSPQPELQSEQNNESQLHGIHGKLGFMAW